MTEFSNLLRQRLASGPKGGVRPDSHPDADTLTAYVERLLPAAERNQVLAHLAACDHCREVTALSLPGPAQEQDQQVAAAVVPATRGWGFLWTPGFIRATVSLAAAVVIAGVIFQLRERPEDRAKTEGLVPPVASGGSAAEKDKQAAPENARGEAPAQPPANASAGKTFSNLNDVVRDGHAASALADNKPAAPTPATTKDFSAANSNGPVAMARAAVPSRRDYVNSDFFANNASPDGVGGAVTAAVNVGELPTAPSPRVSTQLPSTTTLNPANIMSFAEMPTQSNGTQTVRTIAPPSGSSHWGFGTLTALAPKAKKALAKSVSPPISTNGLSFTAMGGRGQLTPVVSEAAAAAPALDSGANGLEQAGAFRRRALADASINAKAEMRESAPSPWRVSGGRLVRPGEAGGLVEACAASVAVEVSTFTAHGDELWVGGTNTALLHSRDGGATCERITLGASASGTIVRIEARGAVVQVKSSSGQSWSSQDGGQTWNMDE